MKTKKFLIISSIVGLFIFVNLSVGMQINQTGQKTDLISLFKSAIADSENPPYWCTKCEPNPCWLVMTPKTCDICHGQFQMCDYTCDLSECDVHAQTLCSCY